MSIARRSILLVPVLLVMLLALPAIASAIAPVGNVTATPGNGQVQLTWTNPGTGDHDRTNVYRSTSRYGTYALIGNSPAAATTYTDLTAVNGTDYFYRVRAATLASFEAPIVDSGSIQETSFTSSTLATVVSTGVANTIDFTWPSQAAMNGPARRWSGMLKADFNETYVFTMAFDDHARVYIDGVLVQNDWTCWCAATRTFNVALSSGWHTLLVEMHNQSGAGQMRLSYQSPSQPFMVIPATAYGVESSVQATPSNATVTVTAPNGGETLTGQANVTWTSTGTTDRFALDTSSDGGASWTNVTSSIPAASSTYVWNPPSETDSATWRVRIRSLSPGSAVMASDASNANFTLQTPAAPPVTDVQAVAQNGSVDLTWTNPVNPRFDHVQVLRSTQEGDPGVVVYTSPNATTAAWTDVTVSNGTTYYYRVRSVTPTGATGPTLLPNTLRQSFYRDNAHGVWAGSGDEPSAALAWPYDTIANAPVHAENHGILPGGAWSSRWHGFVDIPTAGSWQFRSTSGSGNVRLVIDGSQVFNGSTGCCGTVQGTIVLAAGRYPLRYEAQGINGGPTLQQLPPGGAWATMNRTSFWREADVTATPTAATATLATPNGGETIVTPDPTTITWSATGGDVATIQLWMSTDGGATFPTLLARDLANSGSYSWRVPTALSTATARFQVRAISASGRVLARDASNANVTIDTIGTAPAVQSVSANGAGSGAISVSWVMPAPIGSTDHVAVYRTSSEGGTPTLVHTTADAVTSSWTDTTAVNGTAYWYTVRTVDGVGRQTIGRIGGSIDASYFSDVALTIGEGSGPEASPFLHAFPDTGPSAPSTSGTTFMGAWGARYTGWIDVPTSDTWVFDAYASDSYRMRVFVDGVAVVDNWTGSCCGGSQYGARFLDAGLHRIRVEFADAGAQTVDVRWGRRAQARVSIPLAALSRDVAAVAVAHADTITLTSPNGGENFNSTNSIPVTWNSASPQVSRVQARLSTDGGVTYPHVMVRSTANTGSTSFVPPIGLDSSTARIQLLGLDAGGNVVASDESAGNFSIATTAGPGPVQAVTAAAAGSGTIAVGWTMPAPIGSTDHVAIYRTAAEGGIPTLVHSTSDATTTSWTDNAVLDGNTYWYEVRTVDAAGRESVATRPGEIETSYWSDLALTQVEGREIETTPFLRAFPDTGPQAMSTHGRAFMNTWAIRMSGLVNIPVADTYVFDAYNADSYGMRVFIDDRPIIDNWTGACCGGSSYGSVHLTPGLHLIRVEFRDAGANTIDVRMGRRGQTRTSLTIGQLARPLRARATAADAGVAITAPTGGTTWRTPSPQVITWSTTGAAQPFANVFVSLDGGATWPALVGRRVANTGSFAWLVPPGLSTTQARVRVDLLTGTGDQVASARLGADFSIDTGSPPPPAPTVSAQPAGSGVINVSWTMPSPLLGTDHVVVYRSAATPAGEPTAVYTSPNATTTSWTDGTVLDGVRYTYSVRTVDAAGRESRMIDLGSIDAEYHAGLNLNQLESEIVETSGALHTIDADGPISSVAPGPTLRGTWSTRFNGWVYIPVSDTWAFDEYNNDSWRHRLSIDGQTLFDTWTGACCGGSSYGAIYLVAGWHRINWETGDGGSNTFDLRMGRRGMPRVSIAGASYGRERTARATATAATIAVTSPNGGESWTSNANRAITWTTTGAPLGSTVRLSYSTDGGSTWPITIARGLTGGTYSWKPPESLNSATFRVRAELVTVTGTVVDFDTSNANATVDATQITSAISNLMAVPGWQKVSLSWTNPVDAGFDHVNVYRSTNPASLGAKVQTIAAPGTSWVDTPLVNGTRYYYTVRAATASDEERITLQAGNLRGHYYSDSAFGTLATTQLDPGINFNWGAGGPAALGAQVNNFSVRWTGYVNASVLANWIFDGDASDDYSRIWVNGQKLVDGASSYGSIQLAPGWHPVTIEYAETTGNANTTFNVRRAGVARALVAAGNLAVETQANAMPADITPPSPNPVGTVAANSPTQITWSAFGATDTESGLAAQPYSFDGGTAWQAGDTFVRTGLTANTLYTQSVRVRDASGNLTSSNPLSARTMATDPSVSSSHAASTWHGPGTTNITFSNLVPFGAGGVSYYRWAVTTTAGYSFSGAEPMWSSGTLVRPFPTSGRYYLQLRSFNDDGVGGGTTTLGPYWIDAAPPTPDPTTVSHVSTGSTIEFTVSPAADADSGLHATPYSFDNGSTWVASNVLTLTGLSPNTSETRNVKVRDAAGNVSNVTSHTAATLPIDPSVTATPAGGATWHPGGTTFTLTSGVAFGAGTLDRYRYLLTTDVAAAVGPADASWASGTLAVPIGSTGTWHLRVRSFNSVGDGGTTITLGPFKVDSSAPPGVTPSAASPTASAPVLNWTGVVDPESGLGGYRIYRSTNSGTLGSQVGSTVAGTTSFTDPDVLVDDTTYWYTVRPYDLAGNEQVVGNLQIAVTYSSSPPSGASLTIAGGAGAVGASAVTLTIAAVNAAQMQVSDAPDFAGATWEPFATTRGWTLPAGDGTKTIYARFRNTGGTVAQSVADTIILDTTAPSGNPPGITTNVVGPTQVQFTSEAVTDAGAGLPALPYSFDDGASWQAGVTLDRTGLAPNTSYSVQLRARDALGNVGGQRAATATTLAASPSVTSTPLPDPGEQPRGTTFTFTNQAGWGAGGVQYYRWSWSTSPTHTFANTEARWDSSTHAIQELAAGTYYFHVRSYNAADVPGATLDLGPYKVAAPQTPADLTVNISSTQTLACTTTDFSGTFLPGDQRDATVDCTVSSSLAGWNLQAHATSAPFFADFVDAGATLAAYAPPAAGAAQVAFTASGAKSAPAFANGTLWRGFSGLTDIRIGGDSGTSSGDVVTTRVRAELGASAGLTPGARSQTITYTLNPGA